MEIISNGDQKEIRSEHNATDQNTLLHACLLRTCGEVEDLMKVCDKIIAVKGNPKMRRLGEAMKTMLQQGKCCKCACTCMSCIKVRCVLMCMSL